MSEKRDDAKEMQKIFKQLDDMISERNEIPFSLNPRDRYDRKIDITNMETLKQFLMAKKMEGCSVETLKNYRCILSRFLIMVQRDVRKITTSDIRNYMIDYQRERQCKNISMDSLRRVLSSYFNWMEDEDIIMKSPVRKIHHIKCEKIIQKIFTEEEIERLRDVCESIRDLCIVEFLNSSGVRVSELTQLDIQDIDLINNEGIVFGKGAKERIIYFDARTKVHLNRYLQKRTDDCPALFVSDKPPYRRLTPSGVEFICREIGEAAGIDKCYPHRFRRTLATRLIDRGVPIEQVQRILGHTKLDTTLIYAQVNQKNVKLNHSKFSS